VTFYLGTHQAGWLGQLDVPLFVSRRRLMGRKRLPAATCDWALDSGGFSELSLYGGWSIGAAAYIAEVRRFRDEIGRMVWAPCQDWMCEPDARKETGLTTREHQRRTTASYLTLRDLAPDLPIIPVLQGWDRDDYLRHADDYEAEGVQLLGLPVVGLGSVCRRQHTEEVARIVTALQPLRLHGFGVKVKGLERVADLLASSDSLAWSYVARREKIQMPGCTHTTCANCAIYALHWREKVRLTSLFIQ